MKTPAEAAAECDFGKPSARKSGRNPKWPYVPVIVSPTGRTTQIRMRAFATRAEAVAYSETYIAAARPEVAAQWHPTRNGNLTPADVTTKATKQVAWICTEGHEWTTAIAGRTSADCPECTEARSELADHPRR